MTVLSPPKLRRPMTVLFAVGLVTALAAPAAADPVVTTTTTTAPPLTSPSIADPTTTSTTIAVPPTTQPPTTQTTPPTTAAPTTTTAPSTTTTTAAPTTTTTLVSPAQVADLLRSLNLDLARLSAIQAFAQARAAAAQAASSPTSTPAATPVDMALAKAAADDLAASRADNAARDDIATARHRLSEMAVAMYVHADSATPTGATAIGNWANRSVLLALLLGQERRELSSATRRLAQADAAMAAARTRAHQLVETRTAAILAAAHNVVDTTTTTAPTTTTRPPAPQPGAPAPVPSTAKPAPRRPPADTRGPSILGPARLTADELSGWFATTGHVAALTVPLVNLAGFYQDAGVTVGVRADIAFAQAILETGYFGYPAGGQVTTADNNFAGIGACDSCTSGFSFADAKTGVAAQLQLLHEYASVQPVGGPLPAKAGPSGCCGTWMALTGVWATASNYGYAILKLYKLMVEWVIPRRSASAGL
jgi:hypothetical protein